GRRGGRASEADASPEGDAGRGDGRLPGRRALAPTGLREPLGGRARGAPALTGRGAARARHRRAGRSGLAARRQRGGGGTTGGRGATCPASPRCTTRPGAAPGRGGGRPGARALVRGGGAPMTRARLRSAGKFTAVLAGLAVGACSVARFAGPREASAPVPSSPPPSTVLAPAEAPPPEDLDLETFTPLMALPELREAREAVDGGEIERAAEIVGRVIEQTAAQGVERARLDFLLARLEEEAGRPER